MAEIPIEKQIIITKKKLMDTFGEIKAIRDTAKQVEEDTTKFSAFRGKYMTLANLHQTFLQLWDKLYEIYVIMDKEKEFPVEEKYLKGARSYLYECNTIYENIMNPRPATNPIATSTLLESNIGFAQNLSASSIARNRLPKINIPKFTGELSEWIRFRDVFISIVHDEVSLTPIEKFHHLVGSLSGEPLRIVSSFQISGTDYSNAWKALQDRYNNRRILAATFLHKIRQFKPSSQSSSNPHYLRSFLKTVIDNFTSFTQLSITDEADYLKLQLALDCLDSDNRKLFEEKQEGIEFPKYQSLVDFVQQRCKILELSELTQPHRGQPSNCQSKGSKVLATFVDGRHPPSRTEPSTPSKRNCPKCKKDHLLFRCYVFKNMPVDKRTEFVHIHRICPNCLREGHALTNCPSTYTCFRCNNRHHSLLHNIPNSRSSTVKEHDGSTSIIQNSEPKSTSGMVNTTMGINNVLLGTAIVNISDWQGNLQRIRLVIDSGSQFSIISEHCARRLGLPWKPTKRNLCAVGLTQLPSAKGVISCALSPIQNDSENLHAQALVMSSLTCNLPSISLCPSIINKFEGIKLADNRFWESRPVDFLLGSDLFLQIIKPERITKITDTLGTIPTIFGHIVIGVPPSPQTASIQSCLSITEAPLSEAILKSFWEVEEVSKTDHPHPEDLECEEYFRSTVRRDLNGRYMVALPLRDPHKRFPESRSLAWARLRGLELKLSKQSNLREQYIQFMKEYLQLNHMEETTTLSTYITPHHAVFKGFGDEQKIRVVFDASSRSANGSLNENLFIGPKLQKDLALLILNFRTFRVAICADIVKMFRQILVIPEHRSYQHILWRFSQEEAVKTYELRTLTYGQSSSPYLALRVLTQLAEDEGGHFPEASKVLRNDIYVDDIITGANSVEEAVLLKTQLIELLKRGGFPIHRWASNSTEFMDTIPDAGKQIQVPLQPEDVATKVLGIHWDPSTDCFRYKVVLASMEITKRSMLSTIARLFDPMGLLAPVILLAKHMIQRLWLEKLDWDDPPPPCILESWTGYLKELPRVSEIDIPRWIHTSEGKLNLFGFCDASEKCYAANFYLQVSSPNFVTYTSLLTAKTRLAPMKTVSIPRLELCSAHLLTQLLRSLEGFCLLNNINNIFLFTDSTIVLSWLRVPPQRLKTFVANRVGYILTHSKIQQWHYVPSLQNPADVASRGMRASSLAHCELWWKGPDFINTQPLTLPKAPEAVLNLPDCKIISHTLATTVATSSLFVNSLLESTSHFMTLVRKLAYIFRFVNNLRKTTERLTGTLKVSELQDAISYLVREMQQDFYQKDYDFGRRESTSLRFKSLAVFEDKDRVLRVGGRLENASLPYDSKHPILLPAESPLTTMIVDHIHRSNFHLGPQSLQAYLTRKYYIFGMRKLVRKRVWKCIRCFRLRAKPSNPFMANLPASRVSQGRPFSFVGVDFAGPYNIKQSTRRNAPVTKAYLCVFVCMSVKAVHLELVSELTTEAFLAAFDRFVARRGLPSEIRSDCGTNFIGAARELKELYAWHNDETTQDIIGRYTSNLGVQWYFNPPNSPHFGGIWEAAVKSAKGHLKRTLGDRSFHFEELTTIFAKVEAIMNSRPLCPLVSNPDNFDYLSPGHFLIGSALIAAPEQDISDINVNRLTRWQLLQNSVQVFWKRWATEYIHLLQARKKWTQITTPIAVDDLVLLQESNIKPLQWRLGRVTELHPGQDKIVRVVSVRTANGIVKRSVHKLAPLSPINEKSPTPTEVEP